MKIKQKIQDLVAPLYNKVWHGPKGRLKGRIKDWCDGLPDKRRTKLVFALFGAFVLTAFLLFGNACYKIGTRQARHQIEVEHIRSLELPSFEEDSGVQSKRAVYEAAQSKRIPLEVDSLPDVETTVNDTTYELD